MPAHHVSLDSFLGARFKVLCRAQSAYKVFGPSSSLEILNEPGLGWYYRGVVLITLACTALLGAAWLGSRIFASLSLAR